MIKPDTVVGGKYRLLSPLGEGGMGSVWRAEHTLIGRHIAIKFIRGEQNTTEVAARFVREARIVATLRHPNIVDIIDFGLDDEGNPFIVMELLEGQNLRERIADVGRIEPLELVEMVSGALSGLEFVHKTGIVHRDLKPDNIFLAREGESVVPKLVDFGISRSTAAAEVAGQAAAALTRTGSLIGTPHYMSPDQVTGAKDIDQRSDIYSMGVILYEGLTGRLPFDSESLGGLMVAIATTEFPPIQTIDASIPDAIAEVVHKAMARSRNDRYENARDLRHALKTAAGMTLTTREYAAGGPQPTPSAISTHETFQDVRIQKPIWPYAVAGGLALVAIVAGVLFLGGSETVAGPGTAMPGFTGAPQLGDVTVRLRGVPPDGEVRVDGAIVQGTDLRMPRDGRIRSIEVSVPGQASWRGTHLAVADGSYDVTFPAGPTTAGPQVVAGEETPDEAPGGPTKRRRGGRDKVAETAERSREAATAAPAPPATSRPSTGSGFLRDPGF